MPTISILDDINLNEQQKNRFIAIAGGEYNLKYFPLSPLSGSEEGILKRIGDAEIVVTSWTSLNKKIIQHLDNTKLIAVVATTLSLVDTNSATEKGIVVMNVPEYAAASVSELVFSYILEFSRNISSHVNTSINENREFSFIGREIKGKVLGVIGTGNIGTAVARIGNAFGMRVIAYTKHPSEDRAKKIHVEYTSLKQVISESDVISVHVPWKEDQVDTTNLIGEKEFDSMKPDSLFICTSPAQVYNGEALYKSLLHKKIRGAALDDLPLLPEDKIIRLKLKRNLILTPHIGFFTVEANSALIDSTIENIECFYSEKLSKNVVNPESLSAKNFNHELVVKRNFEEALRIKADLLCYGIQKDVATQEFYAEQNPMGTQKTGNVGLQVVIGNKTPVLITTTHAFDQSSPYRIVKDDDKNRWLLLNNNKPCEIVSSIEMPKWYQDRTSTGQPMTEVFIYEGYKYLHLAYKGCGYFNIGKPCKFCGTGIGPQFLSPDNIGEVVHKASLENASIHVCLGGGTRLSRDKNAIYFSKCIKAIRKLNNQIPIWIEMVPPDSLDYLSLLIDQGASSFCFNIEIWDDNLRKEICPGKASVSKKDYLASFEFINRHLGDNKTGSALVIGLEGFDTVVDGIKTLTSLGVKPCLVPFKPWDGSNFQDRSPIDSSFLWELSHIAAEAMIKNNVDPSLNHGCCNCRSCTLEDEIRDLLLQN